MFDPFRNRFDVTKHHRRARFQPQLVCDLHHFEPLVALDFQWRNFPAHSVDQNFTATARDRAEAGVFEFCDYLTQRHSKNFREMLELRWTESVNVDVRIFLADVSQQVDVPFKAELRMMSALHQDLNTADGGKFVQLLIELLERDDVMIVVLFGTIKR